MNPVNDPSHEYYVPIERRRELLEHDITLNGVRATISGVKNDFATITQMPDGLRADFAWITVERIINTRNGEFKF